MEGYSQGWTYRKTTRNGAGNDGNLAQGQAHQHDRTNWERVGGSWMSTKIGSRPNPSPEDKYRREDQYLCIEIQPLNQSRHGTDSSVEF